MKFKFYALKLSAICVMVFVLQVIFIKYRFTDTFLLNGDYLTEPWRLLTSIFLHGGAGHLLYNIFALSFFGSILEKYIGGRKFLAIFFVGGIFANIVSVNFYDNSLGASGAIFGIIGALIAVRPGLMVWAFGLPMPIFIAGIIWAAGDLIGLFVPSDIANIAHLSGMLFGIIFGFFLRQKFSRMHERKIQLDEGALRSWENKYMR